MLTIAPRRVLWILKFENHHSQFMCTSQGWWPTNVKANFHIFGEEMIHIRRKGGEPAGAFTCQEVSQKSEAKLCLDVQCPESKSSLHYIPYALEQNRPTTSRSSGVTSLGWGYQSVNQKFLIWNLHIYFKRIIKKPENFCKFNVYVHTFTLFREKVLTFPCSPKDSLLPW